MSDVVPTSGYPFPPSFLPTSPLSFPSVGEEVTWETEGKEGTAEVYVGKV